MTSAEPCTQEARMCTIMCTGNLLIHRKKQKKRKKKKPCPLKKLLRKRYTDIDAYVYGIYKIIKW